MENELQSGHCQGRLKKLVLAERLLRPLILNPLVPDVH